MGLGPNPWRKLSFSLCLVVYVLLCSSEFSRISAENSNVDSEKDVSTGYKDLGRRSKKQRQLLLFYNQLLFVYLMNSLVEGGESFGLVMVENRNANHRSSSSGRRRIERRGRRPWGHTRP